jgi:hypothetical protein
MSPVLQRGSAVFTVLAAMLVFASTGHWGN